MKNQLLFFAVTLFMIFTMVACNKNVTNVTLEPETLTLYIDETATLTATVQPSDATNKAVIWTSSDSEIATIYNGTVTAKAAGTVTITVTTLEGGFTAECVVTVVQREQGIVINGIKWATRNLASHGKFVENPEDYGALFQWGRKGDGHEQRTSPNYPANDNSTENGVVSGSGLDANGQIVTSHAAYGKFIKQEGEPFDWRAPQNDALWNSGTETVPIKTANDPCPAGWRVPTVAELQSLLDSGNEWGELNGVNGRFFGDGTENLFLPVAGIRGNDNGEITVIGEGSFYWSSTSSTVNEYGAHILHIKDAHNSHVGRARHAFGSSVRCVAE